MSALTKLSRTARGTAVLLLSIAPLCLVACEGVSSDTRGGGNGNDNLCTSDGQCAIGERCMAGMCQPIDGVDPPDGGDPIDDRCAGDSDCGFGELCLAGECGPAPTCTQDSDCPLGLSCNTTTGSCEVASQRCMADEECDAGQRCLENACVDQSECRIDDHCGEGERCVRMQCTSGCVLDADCPQDSYCDRMPGADGRCIQGCREDATNCDAGLRCDPATRRCTCVGGSCAQGFRCDTASGNCLPLSCTADADCDDGLFCNGAETCAGPQGCAPGTPPVIDDGVPCTDDSCDETSRTVLHTPNPTFCDDGDACNGEETCDAAAGCAPGANAADGTACEGEDNECASHSCQNGACTPVAVADCTPCGAGAASFCAGGVCGGRTGARSESFEDGALPVGYSTEGDALWSVIDANNAGEFARTGTRALRSGAIADNQRSSLLLDVDLGQPGTLSFWYRVESEACCDGLILIVDGTEVAELFGNLDWTEFTRELTAGAHTIEWRYSKDPSLGAGADAAWIDDVSVSGVGQVCEDGNACTADVFDGETCVACALPDGGECGGGDECTSAGSCVAGECMGEPIDAGTACSDDGNECTSDACDGAGACAHPPVEAGTACTDDGNPCTVDACDENGSCAHTPVEDGTSCDSNGDDCQTETCQAGTCTPAAVADCTPCGADGDQLCGGGACGGVPDAVSEDFASAGTLPAGFSTEGNAPWGIDATQGHTDTQSARSGDIDHNQSSSLLWNVDLAADGEISFWYKTSTEECCDRLRFLVDGNELDQWRGIVDWTEVSFPVTAGAHVLEWRFTKDGSVSRGDDAVWIDDLRLTGTLGGCSDGSPCTANLFDGNACLSCPVNDGDPCGQGIECLATGTCNSGACEQPPLDAGDECEDDGNPCTADACDGAGTCAHTPVTDGTDCDTNDADCVTEACVAGACEATPLDDCASCGADGTGLCAAGLCGGAPGSVGDDFESGAFGPEWTLSGDADWRVVSDSLTDPAHTGGFSARSGAAGSSGRSSLTRSVSLSADGELRFWVRSSTEACCDGLDLNVDGTREGRWRGSLDWTEAVIPLTAGDHELEWRFTKDSSVNGGSDATWIDDVVITGTTPLCEDGSICTSGVYDGAGCVQCNVNEGSACDEAGECSAEGACVEGACVQEVLDADTPCTDDGNACTADACDGAGACAHTPLPEGSDCDGTEGDCQLGTCQAGNCVEEDLPDCTSCGPDNSDLCAGGICGGLPGDVSEGFESGALSADFSSFGDAQWTVDSGEANTGSFSARSGVITHEESSVLERTVNLTEDGEVRFWLQVESEGCCDGLDFEVDGNQLGRFRGLRTWQEASFPLSAGAHTLTWRFTRDFSLGAGRDAAWIDDLVITGLRVDCRDDNLCTTERFDGSECISCAVEDGRICSNGSACTDAGICDDGACIEEPANEGGECPDEGNPCTVDLCDDSGECAHTAVADGMPCDDGTAAACEVQSCQAGVCTAAPAADCTPCGQGQACAGGLCGGEPTFMTESFEAGTLPPGWSTGGAAPWTFVSDEVDAGNFAARSGDIRNNQSTWIELTVDMLSDGFMAFSMKTETEATFDILTLYIDGQGIGILSGNNDWDQYGYNIEAGTHTFRWEYEKDGLTAVGRDAVWLDVVIVTGLGPDCADGNACTANLYDGAGCVTCAAFEGEVCGEDGPCSTAGTCTAGNCSGTVEADGTSCDADPEDCVTSTCQGGLCDEVVDADCSACGPGDAFQCAGGLCGGVPDSIPEGFEAGVLGTAFQTAGDAPWFVVDATAGDEVHSGSFSARSGVIGNNQSSSLILELPLVSDGEISYWRASDTEGCCDGMVVILDDSSVIERFGGDNAWEQITVPLSAGQRRIEWRFTKDGDVAVGRDALWIDDIVITGLAADCDDADDCTNDLSLTDGTCAFCPPPGETCP